MSGSDLPLESPRKIHQFFNENDGKIYLDIHPIDNPKNEFERKISTDFSKADFYAISINLWK